MKSITSAIPLAVLVVLGVWGLGLVGCEYYPEGDLKDTSVTTKDTKTNTTNDTQETATASSKDIEGKIQELKDQQAAADAAQLDALQKQIADLQKQIDEAKVVEVTPPPKKKLINEGCLADDECDGKLLCKGGKCSTSEVAAPPPDDKIIFEPGLISSIPPAKDGPLGFLDLPPVKVKNDSPAVFEISNWKKVGGYYTFDYDECDWPEDCEDYDCCSPGGDTEGGIFASGAMSEGCGCRYDPDDGVSNCRDFRIDVKADWKAQNVKEISYTCTGSGDNAKKVSGTIDINSNESGMQSGEWSRVVGGKMVDCYFTATTPDGEKIEQHWFAKFGTTYCDIH